MRPWEIHPMLVAFPIALLVAGAVVDVYGALRRRAALASVAKGLLAAGFVTGLLAMAAGWLAFFTVPAHTERAHELMLWHAGLGALGLVLAGFALFLRRGPAPPPPSSRALTVLAAILVVVGGHLGGYLVFRGAAGVDPELLAPEIREAAQHDH
jgi:uncharacterized membrane protein